MIINVKIKMQMPTGAVSCGLREKIDREGGETRRQQMLLKQI